MATEPLPKVLVTYSHGVAEGAITFTPRDSITREPFQYLEQAIERYDPFQHRESTITWPSESPRTPRPRLRVNRHRYPR